MGGGFKTVLAHHRLLRENLGELLCLGFHSTVCVGDHHEPSSSQRGEDTVYGLTVKAMPVATHFVTFNGHQICSVIDFL